MKIVTNCKTGFSKLKSCLMTTDSCGVLDNINDYVDDYNELVALIKDCLYTCSNINRCEGINLWFECTYKQCLTFWGASVLSKFTTKVIIQLLNHY